MGAASLGMYDGEGLHEANDAIWGLIAERLRAGGINEVPAKLDRQRPLAAILSDPDLLLAQCCGYPLVTRYRDRLRYVMTPCYVAPGCSGASHRSRIIVRADDAAAGLAELRGCRAAISERHSNTGMNLFRGAIAPLAEGAPFFTDVLETGSHRVSMHAVAEGRADVAAIDTVSFEHIASQNQGLAAQVRTIGWTEAGPGLPFVTSIAAPDQLVELLGRVLENVVRGEASRVARDRLLLRDLERLPPGAYDRLLDIEAEAARQNYRELA